MQAMVDRGVADWLDDQTIRLRLYLDVKGPD